LLALSELNQTPDVILEGPDYCSSGVPVLHPQSSALHSATSLISPVLASDIISHFRPARSRNRAKRSAQTPNQKQALERNPFAYGVLLPAGHLSITLTKHDQDPLDRHSSPLLPTTQTPVWAPQSDRTIESISHRGLGCHETFPNYLRVCTPTRQSSLFRSPVHRLLLNVSANIYVLAKTTF
jgi:hypothetical protein